MTKQTEDQPGLALTDVVSLPLARRRGYSVPNCSHGVLAGSVAKVIVNRRIYDLPQFEHDYGYNVDSVTLSQKLINKSRKCCEWSAQRLFALIYGFFPILEWLPNYNWKADFVSDFLAGITVGVMSVPQGMAYAHLANVGVVHGLYVNFIPALVYPIFGTSRHAAVGGEAVSSLLMGIMVNKYSEHANNTTTQTGGTAPYTALEICTSAALLAAFIFVIMGLLRLGFVSAYLSDQLVGGFTTGVAMHVLSSQVATMFGLTVSSHFGPGNLITLYIEIFSKISHINWAVFIGSAISVGFLLTVKLYLDPSVKRRFRVPLPSELIVVIVGTVVSYVANLPAKYNCKVVGPIPAGFPAPTLPRFDLMPMLFADTLIMVIVVYSLAISLSKLYAKKHNYKIDAFQEFFAYGAMNIVGSVFQCWPSGNSTPKILVYEGAGAKSQLAGIIGSLVVIITILVIAPFLEYLPNFCLAAIIVVACLFLLLSLRKLKPLWHTCKIEFFLFLITFLSVVLLEVTYGLAIGLLFALFSVVIRTQWCTMHELGTLDQHGLYGEMNMFKQAKPVPGVKIIRLATPLYYANVENFPSILYKNCDIDMGQTKEGTYHNQWRLHVVLDCSGVCFIDLMGINTLKAVYAELDRAHIRLFLANCSVALRKMFDKANLYDTVPKRAVFIELHDAVLSAEE